MKYEYNQNVNKAHPLYPVVVAIAQDFVDNAGGRLEEEIPRMAHFIVHSVRGGFLEDGDNGLKRVSLLRAWTKSAENNEHFQLEELDHRPLTSGSPAEYYAYDLYSIRAWGLTENAEALIKVRSTKEVEGLIK